MGLHSLIILLKKKKNPRNFETENSRLSHNMSARASQGFGSLSVFQEARSGFSGKQDICKGCKESRLTKVWQFTVY